MEKLREKIVSRLKAGDSPNIILVHHTSSKASGTTPFSKMVPPLTPLRPPRSTLSPKWDLRDFGPRTSGHLPALT